MENHKVIGFLINTGPDIMDNYKVAKPVFNVGPPSTRQKNAIKMAFYWRADDGPFLKILDPLSPHQLKTEKKSELVPLGQTFLYPRMYTPNKAVLTLRVFFLFKIMLIYRSLQQYDISEPLFNGGLVYNLKIINRYTTFG